MLPSTPSPIAFPAVLTSAASATGGHYIVSFQLGSQKYALPLMAFWEIAPLQELLQFPGAHSQLAGVLVRPNHQLAVVNGRSLVGIPRGDSAQNQIIIAGRRRPELGLLVDQVHDIHLVSAARRQQTDGGTPPYIDGLLHTAGGPVILLNLTYLLSLALHPAPGATVCGTP